MSQLDHPASPRTDRHETLVGRLLAGYAVAFVCAAVYHALCVLRPEWSAGASRGRHALFVGINLLLALGMLKRPRVFLLVFGVLCLQQLVSHGGDLLRVWHAQHRIDAVSALVVVAVPLGWLLLLQDARSTRAPARRDAPPA